MNRPRPHRPSKVVCNSVLTTLMFVTTVVTSLVIAPVMARSLGQAGYGLWELLLGLVGYVCLLDLGMSQATVRYVAVARGAGDAARLQQVFSTSVAYFWTLALVGALLLALAAIEPTALLNAPAEASRELRVALLLAAATFACNYLCTAPVCFLLGVQAHAAINAFRIVKVIVQTAVTYRLLSAGTPTPLVTVALVVLVAAFVELLCFVGLMRLHERAPSHRLGFSLALARELLGFGGKSAVLLAVATLLRSGLLFVLAHAGGVAQIVFFVFPLRLVEYAQQLGLAMGVPLTPYFADAFARGGGVAPTQAWIVSTRALQFVLFGTILGMAWLGLPFLALWMGADYAERGATSFLILCVGLLAQAVATNANRLLFSLGQHGTVAAVSSVLAACCLLAALPLIRALGIDGAAIATAAFALAQSAAELLLACRRLGLGVRQHVAATLARYGPPLAFGSLAFLACRQIAEPRGYGELAIHGLIGGSAYLVACMATALSEIERRMLLSSLRTRMGPS